MSKANTIRKKALEYARRQDWEAAIREYRRLADVDQSNPNLYNELGDIHLKTGNKGEAYDAFVEAIDAYARVSLYNNAVAVCKKILRLIPARYGVLAKLGCIRKQQGLAKEAESYCLQYLDAVSKDAGGDQAALEKSAEEILEWMADSVVVLDRLSECLSAAGVEVMGGKVMAALYLLYDRNGDTGARDQVRQRLEAAGQVHLIQESDAAPAAKKEGPVITEENIWTDSHSAGQRISIEDDATGDSTAAVSMGAEESDDGDLDQHVVNLPDPGEGETGPEADGGDSDADAGDTIDVDDTVAVLDETDAGRDPSEVVNVAAIIDGDGDTELNEAEDFRSHYDLGMAYLEMNLLDEAIREYQVASRSAEFQVKSLEMIGLCFLKKGQPQLAIRQLSRGLAQIDENDGEALGIKYNLGLAYEMTGETDKAQAMFEDVYVVDVAFRDVAEKIAGYTSA